LGHDPGPGKLIGLLVWFFLVQLLVEQFVELFELLQFVEFLELVIKQFLVEFLGEQRLDVRDERVLRGQQRRVVRGIVRSSVWPFFRPFVRRRWVQRAFLGRAQQRALRIACDLWVRRAFRIAAALRVWRTLRIAPALGIGWTLRIAPALWVRRPLRWRERGTFGRRGPLGGRRALRRRWSLRRWRFIRWRWAQRRRWQQLSRRRHPRAEGR
jgi:hypothetical protein